MTTATRPALRLLDAPVAARDDDDTYLTVPVPRASGASRGLPWQGDDDVAWVPAVLLLAASGRCSCDDCCSALVQRQRRSALSAVQAAPTGADAAPVASPTAGASAARSAARPTGARPS